jgi:hypothetical protein
MQETLGDIEVLNSLGDLNDLSHELPVFSGVVLHRFKAGTHDLAIPLFHQFIGSLSHVKSHLGPLEPLSESLSLMQIFLISTHNFLFDSQLLHHFDGANH